MNDFLTWINQFKEDLTPIGDLARNMKDDKYFPKSKRHDIILEYLKLLNTSNDMICTFEEAFLKYQADMKV